MKTTRQILTEAKGYVEQGWCQGVYAQDENGHSVESQSPQAVRWCLYGAISKASEITVIDPDTFNFLRINFPSIQGGYFSIWNDEKERTQEDVVDLLNKAIKVAP